MIMKTVRLEQLMLLCKVTSDGDLVSKAHRDELVKCGYVIQINGWNIISREGVIILANLGMLKT